jgi:hypothetical protein
LVKKFGFVGVYSYKLNGSTGGKKNAICEMKCKVVGISEKVI